MSAHSTLLGWLLLALVASAAACAGPGDDPRTWDADVHAAGGYWVGAESPCAVPAAACGPVRDAALRLARERRPDAEIARVVAAEVPSGRVDTIDGAQRVHGHVGLHTLTFTILDLADGRRWVIAQACYIAWTSGGALVPVRCLDGTAGMEIWRVDYPHVQAGSVPEAS